MAAQSITSAFLGHEKSGGEGKKSADARNEARWEGERDTLVFLVDDLVHERSFPASVRTSDYDEASCRRTKRGFGMS